jgi:hypothetical protein
MRFTFAVFVLFLGGIVGYGLCARLVHEPVAPSVGGPMAGSPDPSRGHLQQAIAAEFALERDTATRDFAIFQVTAWMSVVASALAGMIAAARDQWPRLKRPLPIIAAIPALALSIQSTFPYEKRARGHEDYATELRALLQQMYYQHLPTEQASERFIALQQRYRRYDPLYAPPPRAPESPAPSSTPTTAEATDRVEH